MSVFADFWPVWKNIYCDQHLKNPKIPKEVSDMTEEELRIQDYRGACKRCYIHLQTLIKEEEEFLEEDIADYRKGEGMIILEEFFKTLLDIPEAIQHYFIIAPLNFVAEYVAKALAWFYNTLIEPRFTFVDIGKVSVNQFVFTIRHQVNVDQYEQVSLLLF